MIKLENISKNFDSTPALENVTLDIPQSQCTVLIGPSGCGKSTLIRILVGLVPPDTGRVFIEGQYLTRSNLRDIRTKIGYVIQEGGLFPHRTALQNITLMAGVLGWDKQRISQRVSELSRLTKIDNDLLEKFPAQLSGGQRQRISLMRALMLDPDILVLDEPLGALDPMIRFDLQTDLNQIFQTLNKTVLMVTHDLAEASYFADTIVLMRAGTVVQEGNLADLQDHPTDDFVSKFIRAQRGIHSQNTENRS